MALDFIAEELEACNQALQCRVGSSAPHCSAGKHAARDGASTLTDTARGYPYFRVVWRRCDECSASMSQHADVHCEATEESAGAPRGMSCPVPTFLARCHSHTAMWAELWESCSHTDASEPLEASSGHPWSPGVDAESELEQCLTYDTFLHSWDVVSREALGAAQQCYAARKGTSRESGGEDAKHRSKEAWCNGPCCGIGTLAPLVHIINYFDAISTTLVYVTEIQLLLGESFLKLRGVPGTLRALLSRAMALFCDELGTLTGCSDVSLLKPPNSLLRCIAWMELLLARCTGSNAVRTASLTSSTLVAAPTHDAVQWDKELATLLSITASRSLSHLVHRFTAEVAFPSFWALDWSSESKQYYGRGASFSITFTFLTAIRLIQQREFGWGCSSTHEARRDEASVDAMASLPVALSDELFKDYLTLLLHYAVTAVRVVTRTGPPDGNPPQPPRKAQRIAALSSGCVAVSAARLHQLRLDALYLVQLFRMLREYVGVERFAQSVDGALLATVFDVVKRSSKSNPCGHEEGDPLITAHGHRPPITLDTENPLQPRKFPGAQGTPSDAVLSRLPDAVEDAFFEVVWNVEPLHMADLIPPSNQAGSTAAKTWYPYSLRFPRFKQFVSRICPDEQLHESLSVESLCRRTGVHTLPP